MNKHVTSRFSNNSYIPEDKSGLATFSITGNTIHLQITSDEFFTLSKFLDRLVDIATCDALNTIKDDLLYKLERSVQEYRSL